MDADMAPGDDLAHIPLPMRFLIFDGRRDAVAGRHRDIRKTLLIHIALFAVAFAAIWHPRRAIQHELDALSVTIGAGHAPPLADALLHNVALDRTHPRLAARAMRTGTPVEQPAVAIMAWPISGRPLRFAPFVFETNMEILELLVRSDRAVNFSRDANRRLTVRFDHLENPARIIVQTERRFAVWRRRQIFIPARQILSIEERLPFREVTRREHVSSEEHHGQRSGKPKADRRGHMCELALLLGVRARLCRAVREIQSG